MAVWLLTLHATVAFSTIDTRKAHDKHLLRTVHIPNLVAVVVAVVPVDTVENSVDSSPVERTVVEYTVAVVLVPVDVVCYH
jgi:hypothetical protein